MKNIILVPFAFKSGYQGGVNIDAKSSFTVYLKNCCVSCVSARKNCGEDTDVALVTNIDVPDPYKTILYDAGVRMLKYEFDNFCFDASYTWSLAFYKLNALKHAIEELHYDNFAYVDSDVYIQSDFKDIWKECSKNILLYDICHGLHVEDYRHQLEEVRDFTGKDAIGLTHYGGEFFAANRENAKIFIDECLRVYNDMNQKSFQTTHGDEFITSLAASKLSCVRNAGAYVYRYWTGRFYLTSTNYKFNPVAVLHVPAEKERGMLKIYDRYIAKGKVPSNLRVWRLLHISRPKLKIGVYLWIKSFVNC